MAVQRQSWSPDEDKKLIELVQMYGTGKWKFISKKGNFGRSPDSCRKRWVNHLNPTIEKGELSADEKNKIAVLQARKRNKWSSIAKQLPGRTSDQIKVFWNSSWRQRDAHPPAPLEGTSSAGILAQASSMLPSNQQTGESCHSIEGLIQGMEKEQLPPPRSLEEARITSHQPQHPQGPSASILPSNQESGESSHSIIRSTEEERVQRDVLLELPPPPSWEEAPFFPHKGGRITSHQPDTTAKSSF